MKLRWALAVGQTAFCWEEEGQGGSTQGSHGLFFALREIAAGEAVTVSYLSEELLSRGVGERRRHLRAKPGMERVVCACARCVAEESEGGSAESAEPDDSAE